MKVLVQASIVFFFLFWKYIPSIQRKTYYLFDMLIVFSNIRSYKKLLKILIGIKYSIKSL